jgi:hypothetical protein
MRLLKSAGGGFLETVPMAACNDPTFTPTLGTMYYMRIQPGGGRLAKALWFFAAAAASSTVVEMSIWSGEISGTITRLEKTGLKTITAVGDNRLELENKFYFEPGVAYYVGYLWVSGSVIPLSSIIGGTIMAKSATGTTGQSSTPATEASRVAITNGRYIWVGVE